MTVLEEVVVQRAGEVVEAIVWIEGSNVAEGMVEETLIGVVIDGQDLFPGAETRGIEDIEVHIPQESSTHTSQAAVVAGEEMSPVVDRIQSRRRLVATLFLAHLLHDADG